MKRKRLLAAASVMLAAALALFCVSGPVYASAKSVLMDQASDIARITSGALKPPAKTSVPPVSPGATQTKLPQSPAQTPSPTKAAPSSPAPTPTPVNLSNASSVEAAVYKGDRSEIDATYRNDAYVKVRFTGSSSKTLKVRVSYINSKGVTSEYTYPIFNDGKWQTYSLQLGDGKYTIKVLENKSGNTYSVIQSQDIEVAYSKKFAPFLIPIQNINYSDTSKAVVKAKELSKGCTADLAKVEAVYKYIVETIKYDYDKAGDVKAGKIVAPYLPDVDGTYTSGKGICYDYSSLMAAMLRSIGIPTKLVTGTVSGGGSHAWNEVYISGTGWIKVQSQIYFDGKAFKLMDSTFASSNTDGKLDSYIGDGNNYTTKYVY